MIWVIRPPRLAPSRAEAMDEAVTLRRLLAPLAVFGGACVLSVGTLAAYTSTSIVPGNDVEAGSVEISDNGAGSAMLGLINAGAGGSDISCIRVQSNGSLRSDVRLRATSTGTLAEHLRVRVERGSGATGFDDCAGFAADERDYYGLGNGVVYDGRLSDMPGSWANGVADPSDTLLATSYLPVLAARTNLVGAWEMGERTRRGDTFTGTPGALVTSRPELMGGAWTRQAVSTTNAVLTGSGRLRPQTAGTAIYRQTAATGAETVTADFTLKSGSGEAGILTRMPTTGDTGYLVRYRADAGVWELATVNAGTVSVLDSYTGAIGTDDTAHVVFKQSGTSFSVEIDGTQRLTATDGTIAATGRTGLRLVGVGPQDDTTGVLVDNFRAYTPGQAANVGYTGTAANNNGTLTGAPPVVAGAHPSPTDEQSGVTFNGTNQTITLPVTGITTAATISGWFRVTNGSNIMRDATTGATAGWSLGFDDGSGTMKFRSSGEVFDTKVLFAPLRGQWHHHALVRNGSTVEYYLDGRRVFAGTASATTAPTSPFALMRDGTAATYTAGRVDQVAIWSRALGADELAAIHDAVSASHDWQQGESHWYRIEVTVDEDPAAASSSATGQFTWEARSR